MKFKILTTFMLGVIILFSCKQPKTNSKAFTVKGTIDGSNTEYVVLEYTDSTDVYISDTLIVENNSFYKQGSLIHTQLVSLTSNLTGVSMEDPNRLRFFLEPNEMEIIIKEDQFPDALVTGSESQIEYEHLAKKIKPYYEKLKLKETGREKAQKLLAEVKNIQLKYAINNPNSYVSAEMINFHSEQMPIDSLKMFYASMDPIIKESLYGLDIQETIESFIPIVDSGDVAPEFSSENSDGDILSLNQFKGKTVLLDFGAGWCMPCKKEIPEVKRIYDKYHSKGLEIIGISLDNDKTSWKETIQDEKLDWHHIYVGSDNSRERGSINSFYRVSAIPAYILIDKNGVIVDRYRGADENDKSLKDLEAKLETLLSATSL